MRDYTKMAKRLGYLSPAESNVLAEQSNAALACLAGLIRAVEKEAGVLTKAIATVSSYGALAAGLLLRMHT